MDQYEAALPVPVKFDEIGYHDKGYMGFIDKPSLPTPLATQCFDVLKAKGTQPTEGYLLQIGLPSGRESALYVCNDAKGQHVSQYGITEDSYDVPKALSKALFTGGENPNGSLVIHNFKHVTLEGSTWFAQLPRHQKLQKQVHHLGQTLKDLTYAMISAMMHKP